MKKLLVLLFVVAGIVLVKCLNPAGSSGVATLPPIATPTLAPSATPAPLLTMVAVPGGSFQRDGTPANVSTVSAFHMSATEITRAQFTAVMGLPDPSNAAYSTSTSDPVQNVSWYQALIFCNKLSLAEGRTPVYSILVASVAKTDPADWGTAPTGYNAIWNAAAINSAANGYRLPTEMEWMWAAMGATSGYGYASSPYTTGYSRAFSGSTGLNPIANFALVNYVTTIPARSLPVGSKTANELGLYDMSGNVWEWCYDRLNGAYPGGVIAAGYTGSATGTDHVIRGGSWTDTAGSASIANRYSYDTPWFSFYNIGFRVVRP